MVDGVITVTPVAKDGLSSEDTYILTPTISNNNVITWAASGSGVAKGYVQQPQMMRFPDIHTETSSPN